MYPSIKTLQRIPGVSPETAKAIRRVMESDATNRMQQIDWLLGTSGVEYIASTDTDPAILYCNAGDTYAVTVLKVDGRFRVGCWGDFVERGNYA